MRIECSTDFVKKVNKNYKKHFALALGYLIACGTCLYKTIQHANITGRCGVFRDILVDEYKEKEEDENTTED